MSQIKPLNYNQNDIIVSLFDDLTITHEHLGRAASTMSNQLLLLMKCSVHPLVQLLVSPGLFDPLIQKEKKEIPDERADRMIDTMLPRAKEKDSRKKHTTPHTRLLAVTVVFYVEKCLQGVSPWSRCSSGSS